MILVDVDGLQYTLGVPKNKFIAAFRLGPTGKPADRMPA